MTVDFLKDVLLGAGEILKAGFGSVNEIRTKQDQSNVVTESDYKSEEFIRSAISGTYPAHNILGEENGFENRGNKYTWVVDPLDGTSNFAAQIPWFGVLVALIENHEPVLAGAYLPMSDELYFATREGGAYKNDIRIVASKEVDLKNLLFCYSLDFSKDPDKTEREAQIIKSLVQNFRNLRSTNSCVDFCYAAEGKIGVAINQTMKMWDIASMHLILEEAGAKVTGIKGNDIEYHPSERSLEQNFTAIAANPAIHGKILDLIGM
ncbi:MAG: inositol monophosphatase [Cytophagales bacterium]|nr:inositol monophosphatase [Cytophagales bacterium]